MSENKNLTINLSCIIDEDFKVELRELIREVVKEVMCEPVIDLEKIFEDSKYNPVNGGV
jgi:uncharacterized protein YfbU (UPF0304 family)